jgi:hypothetical protein
MPKAAKVAMTNKAFRGHKANVDRADVPLWVAAGWVETSVEIQDKPQEEPSE